jgi:hypothetical protein
MSSAPSVERAATAPEGWTRSSLPGARLREHYDDPHVRARILEFLGGDAAERASAFFIATRAPYLPESFRPVGELWSALGETLEAARSSWDRRSLIADLDVEYVHFDRPWEPYLDPGYAFEVQRPVVRGIRETLNSLGIRPLHVLSGRGHHFLWRIPADSPVAADLAEIGRDGATALDVVTPFHERAGERIDARLAAANAGLGRVMEYVAHQALARAASSCPVSAQITAVTVGPGRRGREIVSIDLSQWGDPLQTRTVRIPFCAYLRADQLNRGLEAPFAEELPPIVPIPLEELDEADGLEIMRDLGAVAALARRSRTEIPDESAGTAALLEEYARSRLAGVHDWFYSAAADVRDERRIDVPPCVLRILSQPNDLLLRPAEIQHVVRALLATGWHPRRIAGLIAARLERARGWTWGLHFYDARLRAEFYTRLFTGLVFAGRDELIDFNCRSAQEKRCCGVGACPCNLLELRDALLARRDEHARTDRSFDRLLSRPGHSRLPRADQERRFHDPGDLLLGPPPRL